MFADTWVELLFDVYIDAVVGRAVTEENFGAMLRDDVGMVRSVERQGPKEGNSSWVNFPTADVLRPRWGFPLAFRAPSAVHPTNIPEDASTRTPFAASPVDNEGKEEVETTV